MKPEDFNEWQYFPNKYLSLSYNMDSGWTPPQRGIIYVLKKSNLGVTPASDSILETLNIPELINYVSEHQKKRTLSVLSTIHNASRLILEFMDSCVKAYSCGIKNNAIECVYFFYPWVKCFQTDLAVEVTFFALVNYRNHKRIFKIIKLIPDNLTDDVSILEYVDHVWNEPTPTIHMENTIYHYGPSENREDDQNTMTILYNSIMGLFMEVNFGRRFDPSEAQLGIVGIGQMEHSDDTKQSHIARKLEGKNVFVSVVPTVIDDYFSYCRKAFLALTYMETYRDVLVSYRNLCKKARLRPVQQLVKDSYERYIIDFSRRKGIRLDLPLEELVRQKKHKDIIDFVTTAFAKISAELLSSSSG